MYADAPIWECLCLSANEFQLVMVVTCAHASEVVKLLVKTECVEGKEVLGRLKPFLGAKEMAL